MSSASSESEPPPSRRIVLQSDTIENTLRRRSRCASGAHPSPPLNGLASLLSGIANGAGIGVIRGMNISVFIASNWAVGTFMLISLCTWYMHNLQRTNARYPCLSLGQLRRSARYCMHRFIADIGDAGASFLFDLLRECWKGIITKPLRNALYDVGVSMPSIDSVASK
ncbi:hypothetical protein A0H81_01340 [Grifola frondosa]|uniref:Cytochrome c oxidase assembly protein COX20, mitochondrial n=1 Tax=Grifola frondosa TaxID=5627 RepID=A0A1C7MS35_GRIFR|nr:hypothetical protein A0H81_01340 [Grifola frondosa]